MGIVCPGEHEVGDRKFGDQIGSGPNALPTASHIRLCVWAERAILSSAKTTLKFKA